MATSALELHFSGANSTTAVLPCSSARENLLLLKTLAQKGDGGRELKAEITLGSIVSSS